MKAKQSAALFCRASARSCDSDELDAAGRKHAAEEGDVVGDGHRIGDEAVERDERRERREEGEEQIEGGAGGDQRDPVGGRTQL